jgi:hypothetical protein
MGDLAENLMTQHGLTTSQQHIRLYILFFDCSYYKSISANFKLQVYNVTCYSPYV